MIIKVPYVTQYDIINKPVSIMRVLDSGTINDCHIMPQEDLDNDSIFAKVPHEGKYRIQYTDRFPQQAPIRVTVNFIVTDTGEIVFSEDTDAIYE